MAILENIDVTHLGALRNFDQWTLGTNNATDSLILSSLEMSDPQAAIDFQRATSSFQCAMLLKQGHVLRHGESCPAVDELLDSEQRRFSFLKRKHENQLGLKFLFNPISRKDFKIEPYTVKEAGKHRPPNPYLGATAAMDGLWPGYDKPEYFEQFPFLYQYQDKHPGHALEAFLRGHNIFFNFPETVSRYGVLFVPPPYLSPELNTQLRQHLSTCDKLFHSAPTLSVDTSVAEAKLVLSYVEDDMVAVVCDAGGRCIGVIGWQDVQGKEDAKLIKDFYKKDFYEAPDGNMSALQAFEYMEQRNIPYMLRFSPHGPRIVTQTTAAICHFLSPHTFKDGLGSAVYVGISDTDEGDALIKKIQDEADGVPALIVETAHADTPYFRKILAHYRRRLQDIFLMAGTTVDPKAVIEFLRDYGADGVKLGIAEGTACRTSNTGVALPNAHVGIDCGSIAYDMGYLTLDGWGGFDEFTKGVAINGIQMRQGGGMFMGRREAANPTIRRNGGTGKWYRGMAGADVQQAVLGHSDQKIRKRMEAKAHLHSEGAEIFVGKRSPSTVGRALLAQQFLLMSSMSYAGVRQEVQMNVLRQFQKLARLYPVVSA